MDLSKLPATLDPYFQERAEQELFSGVVLITQAREPIYTGAFGYASRPWQVKNNMATRFDTASITKLFTAVATLQLIEQGLLSFDTSAIRFLELKDTTISPDVTIFHLLTHSSGIGDDADEEAGESYADLWKTKPNYAVTETVDFLPQFIHKPPNFAPGQGCRYCNVSFVLLGLMIEKVSGLPYRDYVRRHIFAQVPMPASGFFRMDGVESNVAEGVDPILDPNVDPNLDEAKQITGWVKNIYSLPPIGSPDGGAHVTAADLDAFLWALKDGKLLAAELTRSFLTPQVFHRHSRGWTVKYGYGLEFFLNAAGSVDFYQKDGLNAGVSGVIRCYPAHDLHVTILSNLMEGAWAPLRQVHEWLLAAR